MAEGGARPRDHGPPKINYVCRYYIHGVCSKGSNCQYIHDRSTNLPVDNICRYYQLGQCSYGERCRLGQQHWPGSFKIVKPNPIIRALIVVHRTLKISQGRYDHVKKQDKKRRSAAPDRESQPPSQTRVTPQAAVPASRSSRMVPLSKKGIDHSLKESERRKQMEEKWAQAKAFVPGQKYYASTPASYAAATGVNGEASTPAYTPQGAEGYSPSHSFPCEEANSMNGFSLGRTGLGGLPSHAIRKDTPLCPYYAAGDCPLGDECKYAHGDICDMCGLPQLHPLDQEQRLAHEKECLAEHEKEMEKAFALQASENQECGICLENVLHKESTPGSSVDRRFGILENCNHCFCLTCIRQWRGNKEISIETHRSCPTCRTHSDFITPSKYWVTTSEEKTKLIQDYQKALKAKPCQYFKKGKGECPFDRKCFYRHALQDGTVVECNQVRRRRRFNADREHFAADEDYSLWDFISSREAAGVEVELGDELSMLLMEIFQTSDDECEEEYETPNDIFSDFYGWASDSSD